MLALSTGFLAYKTLLLMLWSEIERLEDDRAHAARSS